MMLDDPRVRELHKKLGIEGYGIWCAILERIGGHGDQFALDTKDPVHSIEVIAARLLVKVETLLSTINEACTLGLLDKTAWLRQKVIHVPKLKNYADEWTLRLISEGKFPDKPQCLSKLDRKHNSRVDSGVGNRAPSRVHSNGGSSGSSTTTAATAAGEGGAGEGVSEKSDEELELGTDLLPWMERVSRKHQVRWPKIKFPNQFVNQEREHGERDYRRMFINHLSESPDKSPITFARSVGGGFAPRREKKPERTASEIHDEVIQRKMNEIAEWEKSHGPENVH
jgi:hypothetical protein